MGSKRDVAPIKNSNAKAVYDSLNTSIASLKEVDDPSETIWLAMNLDDCKVTQNAMITLARLYNYTIDVFCSHMDMVEAVETRNASKLTKAEESLEATVKQMAETMKGCLMFIQEESDGQTDELSEELTLAN